MLKTNIHPIAQALNHNISYQLWLLQLVGWFGLAVNSF
tara:strand:+ start:1463 stop:1576 length:114 start_codon:yes stop_codon:yes gene_type:complete